MNRERKNRSKKRKNRKRNLTGLALALFLSWGMGGEALGEPVEGEQPGSALEAGGEPEFSESFSEEVREDGGGFQAESADGTENLPEGEGDLPGTEGEGFPQAVYGEADAGGGISAEADDDRKEVQRQPKLLLEDDSVADAVLEPGQECPLVLVFRNRSRNRGIYNLKISASSEQEGLYLDKSSFYFDGIGAGQSVSLPLTSKVSPGFDGETARVAFLLEYEDGEGTAHTGTESLLLPVSRSLRLELSPLSLPEQVYALETAKGEVRVQNTGKATAYNLRARVEGDGLVAKEEVYLGNLEEGGEAARELRVYVEALTEDGETSGGSLSGRLTLTYEDEAGRAYSQEQPFSLLVLKPKTMELTVEEAEEETNQWWISLLVLAILLLSLWAVCLLVLLSRSRRQLLEAACRQEAQADLSKAGEDTEHGRRG